MRRLRNDLEAAGIPVENSKGEWGPGQEEINVRYADALDMADRHVILKNGIKEIAGRRARRSPSWPSTTTISPALPATSTPRSGARTARRRCSSTRTAPWTLSELGQHRPRASSHTRASSPGSWRPTSTPTSASRPAPSRRPRSSGARTTAPPASACAARAPRASASNAASAAPTSTPISPSRR